MSEDTLQDVTDKQFESLEDITIALKEANALADKLNQLWVDRLSAIVKGVDI